MRFEHLTVEADCFVGDRALPSLINTARNIGEAALSCIGINLAQKTKLTILKDVSGIVKPSRYYTFFTSDIFMLRLVFYNILLITVVGEMEQDDTFTRSTIFRENKPFVGFSRKIRLKFEGLTSNHLTQLIKSNPQFAIQYI